MLNRKMIRCKKESIEWLEFELLQPFPEVVHGVLTRKADLSHIPELFDLADLIAPRQVHGDRVEIAPFQGDCDGLITSEQDVGLLIRHADCQAALFYDPVKKVIANVH